MSDELIGNDLVFRIGDGGSPEEFEDICVETDFGELGEEKPLLDITSRCNTSRKYRGGLPDGLEIPLVTNLVTSDEHNRELYRAYKDGLPRNFQVATKDSPEEAFNFSAIVRGWKIAAAVGEKGTFNFTLKIDSEVSWASVDEE